MKMKNVAKNFGLCMVGFIGGSIVTSIGVIHLVKKSRNIQNGISKEVEKWIRGSLFNEKVDLTGHDYPDIVFETKEEAEKVYNEMKHVLDKYGVVTIADFLDLADMTPLHYTNDYKYGWVNIDAHNILPVSDGWMIVFKNEPKEVY